MSNTEQPSMFKTILVAYDGSPSADAAFKAALDLAKTYATSLTVPPVTRVVSEPSQ